MSSDYAKPDCNDYTREGACDSCATLREMKEAPETVSREVLVMMAQDGCVVARSQVEREDQEERDAEDGVDPWDDC